MRIDEPFAAGESWIHHIHPRIRIIGATFFSFVVALSYQVPALISALLISFVLVCSAQLPLRAVGKRLTVVVWFLLLLWLILPITFEGSALYQLGPLRITKQGLLLSAQITLKSITLLMLFMSLISTMTVSTLGNNLNRLHVPSKLVHLLLMTYRYIYVIEEEYQRLLRAIKIRGFRSGTNLHSYKTYAYLIGMLFVRASMRAERVQQAMLCRGFRGKYYTLDTFPGTGKNSFFVVLLLALIFVQIAIEYYFK